MTKRQKTARRRKLPAAAKTAKVVDPMPNGVPLGVDFSRMLSIDEAATARGVPKIPLRVALGEGRCEGINYGGRVGWRVWLADVDKWIEKEKKDGHHVPTQRPASRKRPGLTKAERIARAIA